MRRLVVLISGKLQSGKNTFADILKEEIECRSNDPVTIDYFAKLLKDMCKEAFRPLTDYLAESRNKWGGSMDLITKDENWYENKNEITRHILQAVGTEIVRTVNQKFWIESFCERVKNGKGVITLCSDVRFFNEISEVEKVFKCIKIRVERKIDRNGTINEHVSEKALDGYKNWDYFIENNGTLDELRVHARKVVTDLLSQGYI